jgi:hypothetical protein
MPLMMNDYCHLSLRCWIEVHGFKPQLLIESGRRCLIQTLLVFLLVIELHQLINIRLPTLPSAPAQ